MLDDARTQGWVLNLYAHRPGDDDLDPKVTIASDRLARVLTMVDDAGLPWVTCRQLAELPEQGGAGVALSFDDASVDAWEASQDLLADHGVAATFFVSKYPRFSDAQRATLQRLADAGHDIESHPVDHLDAVDYAAAHGVQAYVDDQVVPEIDALRAGGFDPRAFAYPFGSHSDELHDAILEHNSIVRTIRGQCGR